MYIGERYGSYMMTVSKVISGHTSTITAYSLKGASVKRYWNILKGALPEATDGNCRQRKAQLNIKNMLEWKRSKKVIELKRNIKYGRSGNNKTQREVSRTKQNK